MRAAAYLNQGARGGPPLPIILPAGGEHDPTCPDCRGRKVDRHGFDCQRCAGEGIVDE